MMAAPGDESGHARGAGRFPVNLCRNVWAGVRTAFFLRPHRDRLRVSAPQVAVLVVGLLVPPLLEQLWRIGSGGEFSSSGIPGALFFFPLGFIVVAAVVTLSNRRDALLPLLVIYLATAIAVDAIALALPYLLPTPASQSFYERHSGTIDELTNYWFAFAVAVAWARLLAVSARQRGLIVLCAALSLAMSLDDVWWDRTMWSSPADDTQSAASIERYDAPLREDVLYLQPQLLTRALQRVQPDHDPAGDIYFLGFAPYAEQNVFMREMKSVTSIFESRFTDPARTLMLINNDATLHTVPMATRTALARALKRFGRVMNPDEDILFLYLTSHGSADHHLAIEFDPLQLDDLTPVELRQMLDQAGIKWRIITISACYSGGFIDQLKSPDTLVMTAAAADRTSFGCSNEADYTYFGKAYFDEALRHTNSFVAAFSAARALVTAREKAEGYEPSHPQISLGSRIAVKLRALTTRLNHQTAKVNHREINYRTAMQ